LEKFMADYNPQIWHINVRTQELKREPIPETWVRLGGRVLSREARHLGGEFLHDRGVDGRLAAQLGGPGRLNADVDLSGAAG
jgi:hypothetical protein